MNRTPHLWIGLALLVVLLGGCGKKRPPAADTSPPPASRDLPGPPAHPADDGSSGVVHTVRRGETLYSIARAYGRQVDEIADANRLRDVNQLQVGQRLVIPGTADDRGASSRDAAGSRDTGRSREASRANGARSVHGKIFLAWPVRGEILSPFGAPRPGRRHAGLDIRGHAGEPVTAAAAGKVTFSGSMRGYGKVVILDHGAGLETRYAHNKKLLVKVGKRVSRGQKIATVGRSGNATGDHVHFEVRRNNVAVDPLRYLGS